MLLEIFKQFNWVDILVVIILFRISYIAVKNGLPGELFKFLGVLSAIYLSLHYYTVLSDFFRNSLGVKSLPLEFLDFLSFIVLAILGYLVFVSLRSVCCRFIKMEATPKLNKGGGFILGIGRGFLVVGLIIFMLVISTIGYLKNSVNDSYLGKRLFKVAPATYSALWNNLMSKFMAKEKFNKTILEVSKDLNP